MKKKDKEKNTKSPSWETAERLIERWCTSVREAPVADPGYRAAGYILIPSDEPELESHHEGVPDEEVQARRDSFREFHDAAVQLVADKKALTTFLGRVGAEWILSEATENRTDDTQPAAETTQ